MSTNDLRGRLEKVEQKEIDMQTNGSVNSAPKQSYADIVKHVSKVVEDHEGRRKNVIITGVKEEDKEVTKETIKDIFNGMAIDMQDDLFSVARLGQKKENGKPRRIIVRCCNEADRDKIMARKHNLKTIQNGRFERVYIHEDLTVAQREELFNMYKSAEAKNSIKMER